VLRISGVVHKTAIVALMDKSNLLWSRFVGFGVIPAVVGCHFGVDITTRTEVG